MPPASRQQPAKPRPSSGLRVDGALNAEVTLSAAQGSVHRFPNLRIRRMRIFVEHCLRGHDPPVLTESALRRLLIDPGLLHGSSLPFEESPSGVVISPLTEETGMTQEKTAALLMITLHPRIVRDRTRPPWRFLVSVEQAPLGCQASYSRFAIIVSIARPGQQQYFRSWRVVHT
jgi:hypothetical protein